jgi:hypothetical protein
MTPCDEEFVIGIKMARFNMTKNLQGFRVTLKGVSMGAKWNKSPKHAWQCRQQLHVKN